jgi:hypothetical protein
MNFHSPYIVTTKNNDVYESDEDADLEDETEEIKSAMSLKSLEEKEVVLKKYKKTNHQLKKKRNKRKCVPYDRHKDGPYEEFIMYYEILNMLIIIEQKQKKTYHPTCKLAFNRGFDRYTDLGMPSISIYNPWKQPIKYVAFFLTLIASVFKLIQADNGGRASFIATAIQAFAHLMFTVFFMMNKNDRDLALPKLIGFIFSLITCVLIEMSGNGFL